MQRRFSQSVIVLPHDPTNWGAAFTARTARSTMVLTANVSLHRKRAASLHHRDGRLGGALAALIRRSSRLGLLLLLRWLLLRRYGRRLRTVLLDLIAHQCVRPSSEARCRAM